MYSDMSMLDLSSRVLSVDAGFARPSLDHSLLMCY